jgi:hypothetical protein
MCLSFLYKKETKKYQEKQGTIEAYKIVFKANIQKRFLPPFSLYDEDYKLGNNISTKTKITRKGSFSSPGFSYPSGFHCYLKKSSAFKILNERFYDEKNYIVIKVYLNPEDVTAVGNQNGEDVIVTKKMTIKCFRKLKP